MDMMKKKNPGERDGLRMRGKKADWEVFFREKGSGVASSAEFGGATLDIRRKRGDGGSQGQRTIRNVDSRHRRPGKTVGSRQKKRAPVRRKPLTGGGETSPGGAVSLVGEKSYRR